MPILIVMVISGNWLNWLNWLNNFGNSNNVNSSFRCSFKLRHGLSLGRK